MIEQKPGVARFKTTRENHFNNISKNLSPNDTLIPIDFLISLNFFNLNLKMMKNYPKTSLLYLLLKHIVLFMIY